MAVKIRLTRRGRTKAPSYRVVIMESANPRDGKTIEEIGTYNPQVKPKQLNVNEERAKYWLSVGAQPSDPVKRLLGQLGLVKVEKKTPAYPGISKKKLKEIKANGGIMPEGESAAPAA